jgi:predicted ABC-type transport system involved in lysophospholipase L1 biosynthesis ATPase subunit
MSKNSDEILVARGVHKIYPQGSGRLHILKGIDLSVKAGEAMCIVGSSGAGKSTL